MHCETVKKTVQLNFIFVFWKIFYSK